MPTTKCCGDALRKGGVSIAVAAWFLISAGVSHAAETVVKKPLRISVFAQTTVNLMDWVAKDKGFFDNRGLDVSILNFTSGPAELAAALSGEIDIFNTGPALTIPATQRGACIKYVTPGQLGIFNIVGQKDLSLPNKGAAFPKPLADLKGKTIGVIARGSVIESILRGLLRSAGVDPDRDVTIVPIGGAASSVAAFKAKRVDAFITFPPTEPLLDGQYTMIAHLTHLADSPTRDVVSGTNATTCKFLAEHPDVVQNYCKAIWDAYDFMNDPENASQVAQIYAKNSGLSEPIAAEIWRDLHATFPSPLLTEDRWKKQSIYLGSKIGEMPPFKDSVVPECVTRDPRK